MNEVLISQVVNCSCRLKPDQLKLVFQKPLSKLDVVKTLDFTFFVFASLKANLYLLQTTIIEGPVAKHRNIEELRIEALYLTRFNDLPHITHSFFKLPLSDILLTIFHLQILYVLFPFHVFHLKFDRPSCESSNFRGNLLELRVNNRSNPEKEIMFSKV